jgi:hypothetical protein
MFSNECIEVQQIVKGITLRPDAFWTPLAPAWVPPDKEHWEPESRPVHALMSPKAHISAPQSAEGPADNH